MPDVRFNNPEWKQPVEMPKTPIQPTTDWVTKDSGKRQSYDSGMVRDTEDGKPRFDLLIPAGLKYNETMLYRWASLMARGAEKYEARNWEKGRGPEEYERAKSSAIRHFLQWMSDEADEDHAAAVFFNIQAAELFKKMMESK